VSKHPRRESPAKARTQAKAARAQAEAEQAQTDLAEAKVKVAKEQDAAIARALQEDDEMLAEVCAMQLYCLRLGRLIEEGMLTLTGTIAAIAKMNNTRKARRVTPAQWRAVEADLAVVTGRMLALLPAERALALADGPVTIDLDTTDVEVYGAKKRSATIARR